MLVTLAIERASPVARLPPSDVPVCHFELSTMSTNRVPLRQAVPAPGNGSGSPSRNRRGAICSSASSMAGAITSHHDCLIVPVMIVMGAVDVSFGTGMICACDHSPPVHVDGSRRLKL